MSRILNISNRLPVTVERGSFKKSSGGLVSAMEGLGSHVDLQWIGWPGSSPTTEKRRHEIDQTLRKQYNCIPVFLTRADIAGYYRGFANSVLWPLLHYNTTYVRHSTAWWHAYRRVNAKFCDAVIDELREDDVVWVHDYHLMLLPAMLRQRRPHQKIGFFLHTPFPSYEILRCNSHREELLRGILGAELVGFHTYGYVRHFRSSVLRLLGAECDVNTIRQDTHLCNLGIFPIGIDSQGFAKALATPRFAQECAKLRTTYADKRILLSVERLDYSKGLRRRLEAVDKFLDDLPAEDRDKVVFIFISVPSREDVQEYKNLRADIEAKVGQINGRYASIHNTPIHFLHSSVAFHELCALYSVADVMVVTPLIDGMNLVAKEYITCRTDDTGVLVLSEFTGAVTELGESIVVNPYDIDGMARALHEALAMPVAEQKRRIGPMRRYVNSHNSARWAKLFLRDLEKCQNPEGETDGLQLQTLLAERFRRSRRIACFLDYDGTLREFTDRPEDAAPTPDAKRVLKKLENNPAIDLYLISGRSRADLEAWFNDVRCTLIAEHGMVYRSARDKEWRSMVEGVSMDWKDDLREMLHEFSETTPGSAVEEKTASLVWHYRRCDPEFGAWKARELQSMLQDMVANLPVEVHGGNKIVEVGSIFAGKGTAMMQMVEGKSYDTILVAGDDVTDETMFRVHDERILCLKVGPGPTAAHHRVRDVHALLELLTTLEEVSRAGGTKPGE